MDNEKNLKKPSAAALLPIAVFVILFAGVGVYANDFYAIKPIVPFIAALIVAFLQTKGKSFSERLTVIAKGSGEDGIITMCLIFILAGAFSGAVKAAGGVENTVNLGLSILPSRFIVPGVFLIGCFISLSMGTSVGTVAALTPIAIEIAQKTDIPAALCVAAAVCGAMFGDNLSVISDTTITAVRSQGCEMKDKFRQNFFIVLPAAIVTTIIFFARTSDLTFVGASFDYNIVKILPYIAVLVSAILGVNVFIVLMLGVVLSIIVGVIYSDGILSGLCYMLSAMGSGIEGMYEITVLSLVAAGVFELIKENGGIAFILDFIKKRIKGKKGAKLGIAFLAAFTDICTANNTVAIVVTGSIAKEIAQEYKIEPKTSASLLDIFTSVCQGIIPYGAQLLTAAAIATITPFEIMPFLYYPLFMAVSALAFIIFGKN